MGVSDQNARIPNDAKHPCLDNRIQNNLVATNLCVAVDKIRVEILRSALSFFYLVLCLYKMVFRCSQPLLHA